MYPEKIAGSVQQISTQEKTEQKQDKQSGSNKAQREESVQDQLAQKLEKLNKGSLRAEQEKDKEEEEKEKSDSLLSKDLGQIQDATNDLLAQMNIQLDFEKNRELEAVVVKVRNRESGEVIREIPPEEMLRIAKRMEEMSGMLLDKEI
jgi:flagellar protein FlaG